MAEVYRVAFVWRRPWLMALLLLCYTALMFAVTTLLFGFIFDSVNGITSAWQLIASPSDWNFLDSAWWWFSGFPALALVASQIVFLWPLRGARIRTRPDGKPLLLMVVAAGLVGIALTVGLVYGVAGLVQLIWAIRNARDPSDIDPTFSEQTLWILMISLVIVSWVVWTLALRRFAARRPARTIPDRIIGLLLASTALEISVVLPVDIMMRRRTDCYCATGTFWALCLSAWALLWLCGPGAILAVTSQRRRAWALTHCERCGYEKGPSPGEKCPECGFIWEGATPQAADR